MIFAATAPYSCGAAPAGGADAHAYLSEPLFARAALVDSLVTPTNGYSQLRLAHYATGTTGDWDRLPEFNPEVEPVAANELDTAGGATPDAFAGTPHALALPDTLDGDEDPRLVAIGREAFFRYPVQVVPALRIALGSRAAAALYGLWIDDQAGVGGLVRARMGDGSIALAMTCATCHARPDSKAEGAIQPGLPNATFDLGALLLAADGLPAHGSGVPIEDWGPGRIDVTTSTGVEPARIPDLRPTRWLTYLQQDATVRARDAIALAVRIETLIITSSQVAVRPPRLIPLALAAYLRSLADSLPPIDAAQAAAPGGGQLFAAHCAACHAPPGLTGDPVPLDVVGTDPVLGLSTDRGTGRYRVPSLHGAASRGPLLHDGTVSSVGALLDPARLDPGYAGRLHGSGPVPGHRFGLDLPDADRAALAAYLNAL